MPKGISIFGKKVAALRKKRSLTQASLRDRIGGSLENVKRIESEEIVEVGIELIPRLATALAVDASELKVDRFPVEAIPGTPPEAGADASGGATIAQVESPRSTAVAALRWFTNQAIQEHRHILGQLTRLELNRLHGQVGGYIEETQPTKTKRRKTG
jgi:transcriptional regulator with XRE-family HTH domain